MIFGPMFRHLRNEIGQINKLVEAGLHFNSSDFIRDAARGKVSGNKSH